MPKPKKINSILTETHINHDQIQHTQNNFRVLFFSLLESYKRNAFCASPGLEGITEVDTDPEGTFVSFKVTTFNESSLFAPLQGIATENSWLEGVF